MSGVTVALYDSTNTFVCFVPRFRDLGGQEEKNGPGSGSVKVRVDDAIFDTHPTAAYFENFVKVIHPSGKVTGFVIEQREETYDDSGGWLTLSGRGMLALLANGNVFPEYGLKRNSFDERSFDYGSAYGPWLISSEWGTPVGISWGSDIRWAYPVKWPDSGSQWIWSTSPDADSTAGAWNWFRGGFTLSAATKVRIYAAGDDILQLQLDGEPVITVGPLGWHRLGTYTAELSAGFHLIAAAVKNSSYTSTSNLAGFICCAYSIDSKGNNVKLLKRSNPSNFIVKSGAAPGWFPASILKQLVTEAAARGCEGISAVTLGFTDAVDSDGNAWTGRQDRSFRIGTDSVLDVADQLIEDGIDIAMDADLVLNAWKDRGSDLSSTVTLSLTSLTDLQVSTTGPGMNSTLVRDKGGWQQVTESSASSAYGRREGAVVLGTASSDTQAARLAAQAVKDVAYQQVTITATLSSSKGPQPFADFDIADWITMPGQMRKLAKHEVMSIAWSIPDDSGDVRYTIQSYPEAS